MADRVDEFESIFKRASKARFEYLRPSIKRMVLVTDLDSSGGEALLGVVRKFLPLLDSDHPDWVTFNEGDYDRPAELLEKVDRSDSDLIVTYRNLKQIDKATPHSLGVYLDTLTQATAVPVLVLPDGHLGDEPAPQEASTVLVVTDHLAGDHRLINYAVRLTKKNGRLHLCHIEDDAAFRYYMAAVERIPAINTETAEEGLRQQLLKQPADYIDNCIEVLKAQGITAQLTPHVLMGHRLQDYRRLLDECQCDLVVLNTKDEDQLAMHGLAYPIAVEFRDVPLLML